MPQKIKNSLWAYLFVLALMVLAGGVLNSRDAEAYTFSKPRLIDINDETGVKEACPDPGIGLTRRVMPCIKEMILYVTSRIMIPFTSYLSDVITVLSTIAVALIGALMIGGKSTTPWKDSMMLMAKLSAMTLFIRNIVYFFGLLLDTMDQFLMAIVGYLFINGPFQASILGTCYDNFTTSSGIPILELDWMVNPTLLIWDAVDCMVNALVGGIFSPISLTAGIIGFLLGCLLSNTIGIIIGLAGFVLVLQMIWAVVRGLYIYVGAYIGLGLLFIMAPIFVPLVMFSTTKGYFDRWLKMVFNYFLQPVFLFVYLGMMILAYDSVVYSGPNSLYGVITNNAQKKDDFFVPREDGGVGGFGGWMDENGGYAENEMDISGVPINHSNKAENQSKEVMPPGVVDAGVAGRMSAGIINPRRVAEEISMGENRGQQILESLGLGKHVENGRSSIKLNFFQVGIPVMQVNWKTLTTKNDPSNPKGDPAGKQYRYMLRVLMAFLMALITGYVFTTLLDTLPFMGTGIAAAGDEKAFSVSGLAGLRPPGTDAMASVQAKLSGKSAPSGTGGGGSGNSGGSS